MSSTGLCFKYCPLSVLELENIISKKIHFSAIIGFNDPRDSEIPYDLDDVLSSEDARPFIQWSQQLKRVPRVIINEMISVLRRQIYIACFSQIESGEDDSLMWAYYADKSRGMRIACDFDAFATRNELVHDDENFLFPVEYHKQDAAKGFGTAIVLSLLRALRDRPEKRYVYRPLKDFIKDCPSLAFSDVACREHILRCVTTKRECWEDEREMRLIRFIMPGMPSDITLTRQSFFKEISLGPKSSKADRLLVTKIFSSMGQSASFISNSEGIYTFNLTHQK